MQGNRLFDKKFESKEHSEENSCRIRREETCKVDEKYNKLIKN